MRGVGTVIERPTMFTPANAGKVRARLKTKTRRLVDCIAHSHELVHIGDPDSITWEECTPEREYEPGRFRPKTIHRSHDCPYGPPGTRLWVRERMRVIDTRMDGDPAEAQLQIKVRYEADGEESRWMDYPERLNHVPVVGKCLPYGGHREVSRTTLELTTVRVERIQDISEEDAAAEGCPCLQCGKVLVTECRCASDKADYREDFQVFWDAINAKRSPWANNDWVWCLSFEVKQ